MMSRAVISKAVPRVAAPAQAVQRRCMSTANSDFLLRSEGWAMKLANKPLRVKTGHSVFEPNNGSKAYIPVFTSVIGFGIFITWLPWAVQGKKWAKANGLD